jgi:hypothetical protein
VVLQWCYHLAVHVNGHVVTLSYVQIHEVGIVSILRDVLEIPADSLQLSYSGVTVVLQWCYSGVTVMLSRFYVMMCCAVWSCFCAVCLILVLFDAIMVLYLLDCKAYEADPTLH